MLLNLLTSLKTLDNTHVRTCLHSAFPLQVAVLHSALDMIMPITPHGRTIIPAETPRAEFHAAKPKCHLLYVLIASAWHGAAGSTLAAHGYATE